jgi:uncharacterized protein (DUF58 family)
VTSSSKKRLPLRKFLAERIVRSTVQPTLRLVKLAALGSAVSAAGFLAGAAYGLYTLVIWNVLLLVFSTIDFLLLPKHSEFHIERTAPDRSDVKKPFEVMMLLTVARWQSLFIELTDDLPVSFQQHEVIRAKLNGTQSRFSYITIGKERGRYELRFAYLIYSGGLGLVRKFAQLDCSGEVRIYPDLSQVRGILSSTLSTLILDGQKIYKKVSSGSDFDAIRDYVQGDDPRSVNWRATARTGKLMTNVLRPEKGKVVTIALDCGRMMGIELEGQTKLDRSLESALALAAVALKQGDQVGLLAFSSELQVYIPPDKGLSQLNALIEAVYDLQSEFVESDYSLALSYLMRVQKKRSLMALFSDMESYLYHRELGGYIHKMRRSHVPLLLSLQDPVLQQWASTTITNARIGFIQSTAHKLRLERSQFVHSMSLSGIHVLDVPSNQLALSAVNLYLNMRSSNAL